MKSDFEIAELFMSNLEVNNCKKLKEKVSLHTEEYRDLVREEIKLFEKQLRLFKYLDEE